LRVAREAPPKAPHVGGDLFEGEASHERRQRTFGCDAQLVPPADRERETVPLESWTIGPQDDVGG
jgi:hypothetical protein